MAILKKYLLTILFSIIIVRLSVMTTSGLPSLKIADADKWVHLLMYIGLTSVFCLDLYRRDKQPLSWIQALCVWFFAFMFGTIMELVQYFLPYRSESWGDILANAIGGMVGVLLITILLRIIHKKKVDRDA